MSYNSYYKGAPRGRGFGSRGSFRGRGGDSGSRGRGSSRGRFSWYKERSSGFESRNRYLSGGGGSGGAVRYSGYRRFRGDDIDYPPRERYHRSPDVPRKRIRSEHSYLQISDDDDDLIEGETAVKKKIKKVKKEKTASKEEEPEEGEEVEEEGDEVEGNGGEEKKKGEEKTNSEANNAKDQDSDGHSASEEGQRKKPVYDLSCPHCFTQCDTVQEYQMHLYSSKHINAMRKQSLLHKQTLQRMRMSQRQKQRILEETEEFRHTLSDRTKFCAICKLNYKQPKSTHMTSEDHEDMVKFLNPYCRVCKQRFSTPMFYEHHLCSLDHVKFKALLTDKSKSDEEDGGGKDDEKELNLDNFMILDSVGSVDGEEGESGGEEKAEKKTGGEEEKKSKSKSKPKTENIIGAEYARKVEVYYCDLCRTYLPWYDEQERALAIHCRSRSHLQRYVRYREDRLLRKEAERLHQKKLAKRKAEKEARAKKASEKKDQPDDKTAENKEKSEKDGEKSSEDTAGESPKKKKKKTEDGSEVSQGEGQAAEGVGQEQDQDLEMGTEEDLDKEIGGILDEVEEAVNKSSDEDEDSRGRYDRFQNSEKGSTALNANQSEEDVTKVTTEEEQAAEVDDEDMEKPEDTKSEPQSPTKKASVPESASTPTAASTD